MSSVEQQIGELAQQMTQLTIQVGILVGKLDTMTQINDERFETLKDVIVQGDRQVSQNVSTLYDSIKRHEENQIKQGAMIRELEKAVAETDNTASTAAGLANLHDERLDSLAAQVGGLATKLYDPDHGLDSQSRKIRTHDDFITKIRGQGDLVKWLLGGNLVAVVGLAVSLLAK